MFLYTNIKKWLGSVQESNVKYYLALFLAQMMVGINIVASKHMLLSMTPSFLLIIRFLIATFFIFAIYRFSAEYKNTAKLLKSLTQKDWFFMVSQAVCAGALFNTLLLIGLNYTEASVAGIITSVLPALIAILSILFLGERLNLYSAFCISFAVLGLLVINAKNFHLGDVHGLKGDVIVFLSLLPEAAYYVLAKMHVNRLPLFLVSALMNGINLPFLIVLLFFHPQLNSFSIDSLDILLLTIVGIASGLFYVFWFYGCKNVSGSTAGLFTAVMPIGTLTIAWLFLGEKISLLQFIGMCLVILSIVFNAKK